ncbi:MAG: hypothetical protein WBN89_16805 [Prochlorococcaceae cyanobacterium]
MWLILAGSTAMSIALALPALAQIENPRLPADPAKSLLKQSESPSPLLAVQAPAVRHSVDAWDITWKVIAGLGLLSGMSASVLNWYFLRPRQGDPESRLVKLERYVQNMMHSPEGLIALKKRMASQEQKAGEVALRLSLQEETYKRRLAEQEANINNLAKQLQYLKQKYQVQYLVQSTDPSAPSLDEPQPPQIDSLLPAPPPPPSHADEVTASYTSAVLSNDRSRIRNMTKVELNITQESEDALTRGTSVFNTQLHNVPGGGSYLLIERGSKNWICPTAQTLSSFTTNKPQKGIFEYEESASISSAELKEPAEVQEIREGVWEVINKGVVLVPS